MSVLEIAIEELRTLPSTQLDEAVKFIHALRASATVQKDAVLEATFGCLNKEDADKWEAAVNECGSTEREDW